MSEKLRCFFKGHDWGEWFPWWKNAPRIVFASMEYMNDRTEYRDCARCQERQKRKGRFA